MIAAVHHVQVSIPVGAEDEARAFYCGVLRLKEVPKPGALIPRGGFWLELDGFQIHFGTEDRIDRTKSKAHVAYQVSDLANWQDKLTAAGCDVKDGIQIPGMNRFEFRDPFGNRIEFLEPIDQS